MAAVRGGNGDAAKLRSIVELGPELRAFSAAYETLVSRVEALHLETFQTEGTHGISPSRKNVTLDNTDDEETAQASSVGLGIDLVELPRAFASMDVTSSALDRQTSGVSTESVKAMRRIQSMQNTEDGALELDVRWRELFAVNEAEAEEHEEAMLKGFNKVSKRFSHKKKVRLQRYISEHDEDCVVTEENRFDALHRWLSSGAVFHPSGSFCGIWGLVSMILVIYDGIMIPVNVAWTRDLPPGEYNLFIFATIFWTFDMVLTLNTGVYKNDRLYMSRLPIWKNYCTTWFLIDIFLLSLDYLFIMMSDESLTNFKVMRSARFARFTRLLRVARLLRLFRGSRRFHAMASSGIGRKVLELGEAYGMTWIIILGAVCRSMLIFFLMAHFLACTWYFIGERVRDDGSDASWLDVEGFAMASADVQYTRSLHWSLALMTTNTNDAVISPQNQWERVFTICTIFSSILVLGVGATALAGTISTLNQMNAEVGNTKRQVQRHATATGITEDLAGRITRFAIESLRRRRTMMLDPVIQELLSANLVSELVVSQRARHLRIHPLFEHIFSSYPEALLNVCTAFQMRLFSDDEAIFSSTTWAECFIVTWHGRYHFVQSSRTEDDRDEIDFFVTEPAYFSEVCLFTRVMHSATLTALSFGDGFTLTGQDFVHAVRPYPGCIACVYRYATAFLGQLWRGEVTGSNKVALSDYLPSSLAADAVEDARVIPFDFRQLALNRVSQHAVMPGELISTLLAGKVQAEDQDVAKEFAKVFPELDREKGIYAQLKAHQESERSMSALICARLLLGNRYEGFVEKQPVNKRMSREVWDSLQEIVRWADMDETMVHGMFVFLAIREMGKVKALTKTLPRAARASPESAVLSLMQMVPEVSPSFSCLGTEQQVLVEKALKTFSHFNLAQLLQAENSPAQVEFLQQYVQAEGESLLKFYIMNLIAIMCAIRGTETLLGSLFMDNHNGKMVLAGVQCLQHLPTAEAPAIYWSFIRRYAQELGLRHETLEDFVVARLACLSRVNAGEVPLLLEAWSKLPAAECKLLVDHFSADGITRRAVLFMYLPLYFEHAQKNRAVGMYRALVTLIGILELLAQDGRLVESEELNINIDLSDLASFAREVKAPRIFEATPSFCKVIYTATHIRVAVLTAHWQRVFRRTWQDEPTQEMKHMLRKVEQRTEALADTLRAATTTDSRLQTFERSDALDRSVSKDRSGSKSSVRAAKTSRFAL
eukprot:TRINITY_DN34267_c0_g1_i1.p1 TRINITY_DN34267_c0_g1~~TRINITY_DN34267_c0_g1_i1.p1  ORF type:complete len:1226 (+),score=202.09 TRINITY_DN34267_c0_g1_i1:54-3731(+)